MFSINLWSLFEYDELTINMRQKDDQIYYEILSRIRLGLVTKSDITTLQSRLIKLPKIQTEQSVDLLCDYLKNLPSETVCIFPLRRMCKVLNEAMLNKIDSELITITAIDECNLKKKSDSLKKKISKLLDDDDEQNSGLDFCQSQEFRTFLPCSNGFSTYFVVKCQINLALFRIFILY